MRALFEKDLRLVLIRKSTLFIYIIIGIIFSWSFSGFFSGAYLTMLGAMLALSTISYDDSDNCMAFLFTLPCTRRQYVIEKYLFVYGFSFLAGLVGLGIIIVSNIAKGSLVDAAVFIEIMLSEIPILVITGGIMIPLQLKYGPEKSRIVLMSMIGIVFIIGFMMSKSAGMMGLVDNLNNILEVTPPISLLVGLVAVLIVLSTISVLVTSKIMDSKEY